MFVAAFVVSISCNLTALVIIGRPPTRATIVWLFSEIGQIGNLLRAWGLVIAIVVLGTLLAVLTLSGLALRVCTAVDAKLPARLANSLRWVAVAGTFALPLAGGLAQIRMGLAESKM